MYNEMDSSVQQLVCRTCLKVINENELYINADTDTKYGNVIDILETCVSELNLDISDRVVMCCNCITMLKISYEFKLKCLKAEEKIYEYQKQHNLPIFSKINLADITNFNHLEDDLNSEQYRQHENVAIDPKKTAESVISNHYCFDMADTSFLRKDDSCQENDNCALCKSAGLTRAENLRERDYNDDDLMFDDLTNTDMDNLLSDNYRVVPAQEKDTDRNITNNMNTDSLSQINSADWNMNFEQGRTNMTKEQYCDSLFETLLPCNTTEANVKDDLIGEYVFKCPLAPYPKRKQYLQNSF